LIYLNCSFEETFAAFAGDDPVVKAGGLVLADVADQRLLVLRGRDQQRGRAVLKKKVFSFGLKIISEFLGEVAHVVAGASNWTPSKIKNVFFLIIINY
jgi:hypothetical protein